MTLREDLRQHLLTALGIAWAAASIIVLSSVGAGLEHYLDLGARKTGDRYSEIHGGYGGVQGDGDPVVLDLDDLEALQQRMATLARVTGEVQSAAARVTSARLTRPAVVKGVGPEAAAIQNHEVARGRFLEATDRGSEARVAVLGANLADEYFPDSDAVGRSVRIEGRPFRVIGVLERKGFQLFTNLDLHDNTVFVPIEAAQEALQRERALDGIYVEPLELESEATVQRAALQLLRRTHHLDDAERFAFAVDSIPETLQRIRIVTEGLRIVLSLIGALLLGMAGVGLANLVVARAHASRMEFAVRAALGARRLEIGLQVTLETLVLVLCSGGAGALAGIAFSLSLAALPLPAAVPRPVVATSMIPFTLLALSLTAALASWTPTRIATSVAPSAALRDAR